MQGQHHDEDRRPRRTPERLSAPSLGPMLSFEEAGNGSSGQCVMKLLDIKVPICPPSSGQRVTEKALPDRRQLGTPERLKNRVLGPVTRSMVGQRPGDCVDRLPSTPLGPIQLLKRTFCRSAVSNRNPAQVRSGRLDRYSAALLAKV